MRETCFVQMIASLPRINVTASAKRLLRDNRVEELVPWIWSGTNHHDTSSFYLLRVAGPKEGEPLKGCSLV